MKIKYRQGSQFHIILQVLFGGFSYFFFKYYGNCLQKTALQKRICCEPCIENN